MNTQRIIDEIENIVESVSEIIGGALFD